MLERFHGVPITAADASELRRLGLMDEVNEGPSLGQALRSMLTDPGATGPQRRRIGLSALRDLAVGTASAGGYLTSTTTSPLEPLLRRYSIVAQAGVGFLGPFDGATVVPTVGTRPSAGWIAAEGDAITQSEPVLAQLALEPRYAAIFMKASRALLMRTSRTVESVVAEVAGDAIGRSVDAALLAGSGAAGQPTGLINTAGIHSQSGTNLALAGLLNMREQVLLAGAQETRLAWFGHPSVQELLASRERHSGGGRTLWDDTGILGRPAFATTAVPAGTLVLCDPARITVASFAGGVGVETDPFSSFRAGLVAYRLILPISFGFSPAAAFAVATSIT